MKTVVVLEFCPFLLLARPSPTAEIAILSCPTPILTIYVQPHSRHPAPVVQQCADDFTSRENSEAEAGSTRALLQLVPADMTLGFRENNSGLRISDLDFFFPLG